MKSLKGALIQTPSVRYLTVGIAFFIFPVVVDSFFLKGFLIWISLNFLTVSLAYVAGNHRLTGKNSLGQIPLVMKSLLTPFLATNIIIWYFHRWKRREEAPFNQVCPNLYIGRWTDYNSLPEKITSVVDLTNEFNRPQGEKKYISLPTLDESPPNEQELIKVIQQLKESNTPTYIHCAEGHGRSALVCSLFLIAMGHYQNFQDAFQRVQSQRPKCHLSRSQRQFAQQFVEKQYGS